MPNPTTPSDVERAFRTTGSGWILEMTEPASLLKQVALDIDQFITEYQRRYQQVVDPFALLDQNPDKAAAFFELYTNPPVSMDMRIVVWQVIHGAEIQSVRFAYERDGGSELVIVLNDGHRRAPEEFRGSSLADIEIIKHFGVLTIDGKKILDGYYAAELPE